MSSDNLWLVCKECGASAFLAKVWGTHANLHTDTPADAEARVDGLSDFLTEHLYDCQQRWGVPLFDDAGFTVETDDTYERRRQELEASWTPEERAGVELRERRWRRRHAR